MKRLLYLAAIACIAIFASCEKEEAEIPIDEENVEISGSLYGIWALSEKSETYPNSEGPQAVYNEDYTPYHFYLALSEFPFPHAIAKKGSLSMFDLDDVDVDAVRFTYNPNTHQINFSKTIWLSAELLTRSMRLSGKFTVTELTDTKLVIKQKEVISGKIIGYSYTRQK
ncbi:MAG: hypothetical protein J6S97_01695 [Bacteroidales bacterium]|nr:hypothetical protein [Bacteroidales bacterium]MBP5382085.1 hypothetical protein [Bacteroidales bacterium]MBP5521653.1 hypothetical protein [Bacteroidales bacterium]